MENLVELLGGVLGPSNGESIGKPTETSSGNCVHIGACSLMVQGLRAGAET